MSDNEQPKSKDQEPLLEQESCPVCGSKDKASERIFNSLVAKGTVGKETKHRNVFQVQLLDMEKLKAQALLSLDGLVKIPTINYFWEVCDDCGAIYCRRIELTDTPGQAQLLPPQMPGGRR